MIRALHRLTGGRLRIWLVSHGRDAKLAAQLVALVGLYLLASSMDYQDQLDAANARAEESARVLAAERALHGVPNPAIVLDARTAERYGLRLAEIAGGLDAERLRAKGVQ